MAKININFDNTSYPVDEGGIESCFSARAVYVNTYDWEGVINLQLAL